MKTTTLGQSSVSVARTKSLAIFFAVAFAFTWLALAPAVLSAAGVISLSLSSSLLITVATLGPLLGGVSAAAYESGSAGVRQLLAQARRWRLHPAWYAIVLLGPALIMLTAFSIWRSLGGPQLSAPPLNAWLSVPILVVVLLLPALFEEIGWRGFALPRLQTRYGALAASLIVGVAWAIWHAPIWFIPDAGFSTLPFPVFMAFTVALSILFTWLYNSTGSVLLPALAHAVINATPLPWNTAVYLLPEGARGMHLQIPVTVVIVALALLLILLTSPKTLTGDSWYGQINQVKNEQSYSSSNNNTATARRTAVALAKGGYAGPIGHCRLPAPCRRDLPGSWRGH